MFDKAVPQRGFAGGEKRANGFCRLEAEQVGVEGGAGCQAGFTLREGLMRGTAQGEGGGCAGTLRPSTPSTPSANRGVSNRVDGRWCTHPVSRGSHWGCGAHCVVRFVSSSCGCYVVIVLPWEDILSVHDTHVHDTVLYAPRKWLFSQVLRLIASPVAPFSAMAKSMWFSSKQYSRNEIMSAMQLSTVREGGLVHRVATMKG